MNETLNDIMRSLNKNHPVDGCDEEYTDPILNMQKKISNAEKKLLRKIKKVERNIKKLEAIKAGINMFP